MPDQTVPRPLHCIYILYSPLSAYFYRYTTAGVNRTPQLVVSLTFSDITYMRLLFRLPSSNTFEKAKWQSDAKCNCSAPFSPEKRT